MGGYGEKLEEGPEEKMVQEQGTCPTRSDYVDLARSNHTFREGNGTPLQYSCLENPMDGEAW